MRRMTRLMLCLALIAPAAALPVREASAAEHEVEKIAVVEVQRVLLETSQGIKAKKKLESKFKKGQVKLDRKTQDLHKEIKDLQSKQTMLSQAELLKRQEALMLKEQELQQLYMDLQQEISNEEALLVEKVYKNVEVIVKAIAAEEDLDIVLVKAPSTVLYSNPKLDITNRVIVAYDKKHK